MQAPWLPYPAHMDAYARITGDQAIERQNPPDQAPEGLQGTTSAKVWTGQPSDEHHTALSGGRDYRIFRKMMRSPSVVAFWRSLLAHLMGGVPVIDESEDTHPDAKAYAEKLIGIGQARPKGMRPFHQDLSEMWLALAYGRCTLRMKTWYDAESNMVLYRLYYTEPDTIQSFILDEDDDLVAIQQRPTWELGKGNGGTFTGPLLDVNRTIHLVFNGEGRNYNGVGLLRPVYPLWREIEALYKVDVVGLTRFASPAPVVQVDYKAAAAAGFVKELLAAEITRVTEQLKNLTSHEQSWLQLPTWMTHTTYPENNAYQSGPVLGSISHRENRVGMQFSASLMLLGDQHTSGNRSLGQTAEREKERWAQNLGRWLASEINSQLLARMQWYQFGSSLKPEQYARLKFTGLRLPAWMHNPQLLRDGIASKAVVVGPSFAHDFRSNMDMPTADHEDDWSPEMRQSSGGSGGAVGSRLNRQNRQPQPPPANLPTNEAATPDNQAPDVPEDDS